jgi:hypothetical protein
MCSWSPNELYTAEYLPSILQWKTEVSVTKAKVFREIHFQNMTSSVIVWAFILLFISILNICNVFCAVGRKNKRKNLYDETKCGHV